MNDEKDADDALPENSTIPRYLSLNARGFADEGYAKEALYKLHSVLTVISQTIDLTNLDGVTVAFDYDEALAELDRGYETDYKLTASSGVAIGVAMAPTVIRDGVIKTHLVLNANYALSVLEEEGQESEYFGQALHLVAHECAHVEVTAAFDNAFPKVLLQQSHKNILDNMRWQVILAAWDEYAVCRIAGTIGYDPTEGYLETLLTVLQTARSDCFELIKAYRTHGDVGQVVMEVYGKLGDLLKFSAYFVGAVSGQKDGVTHPKMFADAAEFEWFNPFFVRAIEIQTRLWEEFGKWEDQDTFEAFGNILEEMAESIGIEATRTSDDDTHFNIPFRVESMP